ncbi:MAG: hypothetical protein Ta2B_23390 [Termitinemataceae bacterium]|nr:MAG: hypothetical protein Ta2B_23390 [Termitinemataceae bacterium]
MKTNLQGAVIVGFCCLISLLSCRASEIPLKNAEVVDFYSLYPFSPTYTDSSSRTYLYGDDLNRINANGLNIKAAYKTSDGVDHIVLRGKISKGIPIGLLYSGDGDEFTDDYEGRGDFEVLWAPTVSTYSDYLTMYNALVATGESTFEAFFGTGSTPAAYVLVLDPVEFSAEWKNKGGFTAVTLFGMLRDDNFTTITEINDSLNLYGANYQMSHYPDLQTFFPAKPIYRRTIPGYNPNNFLPYTGGPDEPDGEPRGGYSFLISEAAEPREAVFEIEYMDGSKKTVIVDYREVEFESVPLKKSALPLSLDSGLKIYNFDDTATSIPQSGDQVALTPMAGDDYADAMPTPLDSTGLQFRLWFEWTPFNSTCRIKEVNIIASDPAPEDIEIVWDDEFDTLNISCDSEIITLEMELILTERYYYDSNDTMPGPDEEDERSYVDRILLSY